jgi:hypothetical protein
MAAMTIPPENWTIGREMPKKFRMVKPRSSMMVRKTMLLMAILRARWRYTGAGASPTRPKKTRAEPSGLISGRSALKAIRNEWKRDRVVLQA